MQPTDPPSVQVAAPGFDPPKRRAGARPGLRRAPPAPIALRVLFWLDVVAWAGLTLAAFISGTTVAIAVVPFAAALVAVAFGYRGMGRPSLWARGLIAVAVGGISAALLARGVLQLVRFGVFDWVEWVALPVLVWQGVGAVAVVQALHLLWRTERERRREAALTRPLPAGKREYLRPGRPVRDRSTPRVLAAVVAVDVVASVIAVVVLAVTLGGASNLRAVGGLPQALSLAFPALILAHQCWERHPVALLLRPWFGGGVALVSAGVVGLAAPWTLALAVYAVLAGLAVTRAQAELAERAATDSG